MRRFYGHLYVAADPAAIPSRDRARLVRRAKRRGSVAVLDQRTATVAHVALHAEYALPDSMATHDGETVLPTALCTIYELALVLTSQEWWDGSEWMKENGWRYEYPVFCHLLDARAIWDESGREPQDRRYFN